MTDSDKYDKTNLQHLKTCWENSKLISHPDEVNTKQRKLLNSLVEFILERYGDTEFDDDE